MTVGKSANSIINTYLSYLKSSGKSKKTIHEYELNLTKWLEWGKIKTLDDLIAVTSLDIEEYNEYLDSKGLSDNSKFSYTICIKALFHYLIDHDIVSKNPVKLKFKIKNKNERIYWGRKEVLKFLGACETLQDKALYQLIFETGMRYSDFIQLTPNSFVQKNDKDENGNVFTYYLVSVIGKGGKQRTLGISNETYDLIQEYIRVERPSNCLNNILFVTPLGNPVSNKVINANFKRLAKKAGFPYWKVCHIHMTRYAFATMMVEDSSTNLKELQELMGHASIGTTTKIYTHINQERLAMKMAQHGLKLGGKEIKEHNEGTN